MNNTILSYLREWFDSYTHRFFLPEPADQKNIDLKREHTAMVCDIAQEIAFAEGLAERDIFLAAVAGLLHDVGRFPQYARYRTFRDSISINHGKLGAEVLEQEGTLRDLPSDEQSIILTAVRFHNAYLIPALGDPRTLLHVRLVRDADKLDIWRIFTGFFEGKPEDRASQAGLGLPDEPGFSPEVVAAIFNGKSAALTHIRTLNDFKLMQLSWIPDLNFSSSLRLLAERRYIDRLVDLLPDAEEVTGVRSFLHAYVDDRLRQVTAP